MNSDKTEDQWREQLTPEQYVVLREKGTEMPFSGALLDNHNEGVYACAACGEVVFRSQTKFDSGSGWPSFYDAESDSVRLTRDSSHGMERVEVTCASCGSHLGHLFPDAYDQPTGQRYCINSVSLQFKDNKSDGATDEA